MFIKFTSKIMELKINKKYLLDLHKSMRTYLKGVILLNLQLLEG